MSSEKKPQISHLFEPREVQFVISFNNEEIKNFLEVSLGRICDPERSAPENQSF